MRRRGSLLVLVATSIIVSCVGCAAAKLPASLLGVWTEDMVKESWPADKPKFVKSNGTGALRFEQQDRKAVVFVSLFEDAIKHERAWSEPLLVKETGNNSWSFQFHNRDVSLRLDEKNQLQVSGLSMRSYNQDLVKKDPEPVEAIFIKKL